MHRADSSVTENEFSYGIEGKASRANPSAKDGMIAKAIESQTAKLPSHLFLWVSGGAMAAALALKMLGKNHVALFSGQWAAPLLLIGLYNKVVKVGGYDSKSPVTS
jgi:hypothetical protein